jgi:hypothetical protein
MIESKIEVIEFTFRLATKNEEDMQEKPEG